MKIKFIFFIFFQFIFLISSLNSDEVEIVSDNIKILENGKIIESIQTNAIIKKKGLYIEGDYSVFNKETEIIKFKKNVFFKDIKKNITIETENAKNAHFATPKFFNLIYSYFLGDFRTFFLGLDM